MAHKKAALKAIRQTKKRVVLNLRMDRRLERLEKEIRTATAAGETAKARELMPQLQKVIDKGSKRHLIKKNTASRKKSRLEKAIRKVEKK
ncbi:MAG: 30S ribosomal protein S20 [bacterium]|nr:30S ribosomal protein S20 [bacterium]